MKFDTKLVRALFWDFMFQTTGFDKTLGRKCNLVFELFEMMNSSPLLRYVLLQGYDFT